MQKYCIHVVMKSNTQGEIRGFLSASESMISNLWYLANGVGSEDLKEKANKEMFTGSKDEVEKRAKKFKASVEKCAREFKDTPKGLTVETMVVEFPPVQPII